MASVIITEVTTDGPGCSTVEETNEDYLVKMLEEQNRILEQDSRYTQKISRTESISSTNTVEPLVTQTTPPPTQTLTVPTSEQVVSSTGDVATPTVDQELESDEEELITMWGSVLKNWEENVKKNNKLIKQLVRRGIPDPLRGMAWQLLSGPHDESLKNMYPSLITEESCPFEKQIKRDLDRTFPEHSFFKDRDGIGQESLLSVMKAYSLYDREVGYCQGSLFLAGELLMHMPEEETFCVFVQLMDKHKLRELYKPSMAKLGTCFYQLENLVEELFPKLHIHFKALGFYTSMYSSSWFLTLFASTLSLNIAFRIMDAFLEDGLEVIFRIGLALMEHSHDDLMSMDLEEMTKLLQKGVKTLHESDPDELINRAFKIKLSSKKLKKLEREYCLKKEKQATENSNLILLRDENENLEKRVVALEMECAALADRLIQGQVTRAEEAEEMFILRNEVSKLRKELKALKEEQSKWGSVVIDNNYSTNASQSFLEISERDRSISAPSLRDDLVSSPSIDNFSNNEHVSREEAQQCLRELGISPTTTPTIKPLTPVDTQSTSTNMPSPSTNMPSPPTNMPSSPAPYSQAPELDMILQELATAKIHHVETLHGLELKSLELRGVLQREKTVKQELEQARVLIDTLMKKNQEDSSSSPSSNNNSICPHCGLSYTDSKVSLTGSSKTNNKSDNDDGTSCPSQTKDNMELINTIKTIPIGTSPNVIPTSDSIHKNNNTNSVTNSNT